MEGKERKRADDLPAGAVEQVRELLNRPRSSADFSPAARYAVQRLADYAEQEHKLRGKAEERCVKMNGQVTDARLMVEAQARTIDDLRQQLSFMQQARWDTGLTPRLMQETAEFAIWVYENGLEKIKEWIKADKDGRLVVLPCKVGDTVYTLRRTFDGADVVGETELWWTDIPLLGKTVFLTREEAEKALEAVNDE